MGNQSAKEKPASPIKRSKSFGLSVSGTDLQNAKDDEEESKKVESKKENGKKPQKEKQKRRSKDDLDLKNLSGDEFEIVVNIPKKKEDMISLITKQAFEIRGHTDMIQEGKRQFVKLIDENERCLEKIEEKDQVIAEKDNIIQRYIEENVNLKTQIEELGVNLSEKDKILKDSTSEIRNLQNHQLLDQEEVANGVNKKSRFKKGLFQESSPSTSDSSSSTNTSTGENSVTQSSTMTSGKVTSDAQQEDKIVTRSIPRRRKADVVTPEPSSPPKTSANDARHPVGKAECHTKRVVNTDEKQGVETIEETKGSDTKSVTADTQRDILHHHSRIESHITLLGQHSEKQRHTLEHHQKLLTLEREERNRSIEKIQELQSTNRENQHFSRQQIETIDTLNRKLENQNITLRQLQQDLGQVREASNRMRKVQADLIQARRELEEEKVVRGIRDKQQLEKENELAELRRVCTEERSLRQGLNEELQRIQNACVQHMDELENQRLFRQTQDRELQGREERIQENEQRYQEEHATRLSLEDELRRLRIENDELRRSRDGVQNDLREERQ